MNRFAGKGNEVGGGGGGGGWSRSFFSPPPHNDDDEFIIWADSIVTIRFIHSFPPVELFHLCFIAAELTVSASVLTQSIQRCHKANPMLVASPPNQ